MFVHRTDCQGRRLGHAERPCDVGSTVAADLEELALVRRQRQRGETTQALEGRSFRLGVFEGVGNHLAPFPPVALPDPALRVLVVPAEQLEDAGGIA